MMKAVKKNLFAYVLWLFIALFSVSFEFSFLTRIKDDEKINFFISSTSINETEFFDYLKENEPSYLRSISYRNIDYNRESDFLSVLSSYGMADTDIFILPSAALTKVKPQYYFFSLDETTCHSLFDTSFTYYEGENGLKYGFKINSPFFQDAGLEYYLFFAKNSLHLGELNASQLDGCITFARLFIN